MLWSRTLPRWTASGSRGNRGSLRRRLLATDSAPRLVKVALERLTAEAFAPFGEICGTMAGGEPSLCVSQRIYVQRGFSVCLPDFAVNARFAATSRTRSRSGTRRLRLILPPMSSSFVTTMPHHSFRHLSGTSTLHKASYLWVERLQSWSLLHPRHEKARVHSLTQKRCARGVACHSAGMSLWSAVRLSQLVHAALQVRAFLLDGTQGVILHREVWHALSRFTLSRGAHADFYFLTDIETQLEIEAGSAATKTNAYQELSAFLRSC